MEEAIASLCVYYYYSVGAENPGAKIQESREHVRVRDAYTEYNYSLATRVDIRV